MKISLRAVSLLPCVAVLLAVTPAAHAASVTVSLYTNAIAETGSLPLTPYSGSPAGTDTVTNSSAANLFNFYTSTDVDPALFLLTGTSGSNGDTTLGTIGSTGSFDKSIWVFTGTTYLNGSTNDISFLHDDGVNVFLNGSTTCTVCAGDPSVAGSAATATVAAGNYSFVIDYSEVNGAPGELKGSIGTLSPAPTPEPSSLMLLGTGVLAAAGVVRRRIFA